MQRRDADERQQQRANCADERRRRTAFRCLTHPETIAYALGANHKERDAFAGTPFPFAQAGSSVTTPHFLGTVNMPGIGWGQCRVSSTPCPLLL